MNIFGHPVKLDDTMPALGENVTFGKRTILLIFDFESQSWKFDNAPAEPFPFDAIAEVTEEQLSKWRGIEADFEAMQQELTKLHSAVKPRKPRKSGG